MSMKVQPRPRPRCTGTVGSGSPPHLSCASSHLEPPPHVVAAALNRSAVTVNMQVLWPRQRSSTAAIEPDASQLETFDAPAIDPLCVLQTPSGVPYDANSTLEMSLPPHSKTASWFSVCLTHVCSRPTSSFAVAARSSSQSERVRGESRARTADILGAGGHVERRTWRQQPVALVDARHSGGGAWSDISTGSAQEGAPGPHTKFYNVRPTALAMHQGCWRRCHSALGPSLRASSVLERPLDSA